jgi:hypothetical protein
VTNLTSGAKILLRKKKTQHKITITVIVSATPSGKDHHVIPHDSRHRMLCERRKIGVKIRPM